MASTRSFAGAQGGREHFIVVEAPQSRDLPSQIRLLADSYREAQARLALGRTRRCSGASSSATPSIRPRWCAKARSSTIWWRSPSSSSARFAAPKSGLLAYHIDAPDGVIKRRLSPRHLLVEKAGKRHLWSARLCCEDAEKSLSSEAQTRVVFDEADPDARQQGASLPRSLSAHVDLHEGRRHLL